MKFVQARIDDTHACGGDSGGPWLVRRGAGFDADYMQFAVHSGRNGTPKTHKGPLLADNMAWIESQMRTITPRAFDVSWVTKTIGGYSYKSSALAARAAAAPLQDAAVGCMSVTPVGAVESRACVAGSATQLWRWMPSGELRNRSADGTTTCLEVTPTVHVAACNGTLAQRVSFTQSGQLRGALDDSKCLKPSTSASTVGAALALVACNTLSSPTWTY